LTEASVDTNEVDYGGSATLVLRLIPAQANLKDGIPILQEQIHQKAFKKHLSRQISYPILNFIQK
jgi:hypothetical protein